MRSRLTEEKNAAFFSCDFQFFGLLTAVGVVASSDTVFSFFGRFFCLLDLFTHFLVHYLLALDLLPLIPSTSFGEQKKYSEIRGWDNIKTDHAENI